MEEENKFWLAIFRLMAVVVCVLIVSVSGCVSYANHKTADLVKSGSPAVDARCAVYNGSNGTEAACALSGAKTNQR